LCPRTFALFTLRTLLNAIICCSQLNTRGVLRRFPVSGFLVIDAVGLRSMYFVVMPRLSLIVILVMYVRYLYSINCPIVIYLPSMLLFILWRDTTSQLWTPVQFPLHRFTIYFTRIYFYLHYYYPFYHSIRSILYLQQTGEIDNLIVSWEKSTCLCCVQVSCCCWGKICQQAVISGALVRSITKLASITFLSLVLSPTGSINLGFITEGRLVVVSSHLLLGFPTGRSSTSTPHHQ
jgi:hypothetical protein